MTTAKSSGVEGVPVPGGARPYPGLPGGWQVKGMTYGQLLGWYERRMPENRDFPQWRWCDTGGGDTLHAHIYTRGVRVLNVTVMDEHPPGILIGKDRSGPC